MQRIWIQGASAFIWVLAACAGKTPPVEPRDSQSTAPLTAAAESTATTAEASTPAVAAPTPAAAPTASTPAAVPTPTPPATPAAVTTSEPAAKPAEKTAADAGKKATEVKKEAETRVAAAAPPKAEGAATKTGYVLTKVAEPDKKTQRLWKSKCASCHGDDGKGDTEKGHKMKVSDLSSASWQTSLSNDKVKSAILEGTKKTTNGVKQEMDPFKDELTPAQTDQLVALVRWLGAPK